jgi:hypothetical protein
MMRLPLLLVLIALVLPSCAIAHGSIGGVRVSIACQEKPTGTETHEVDFNRVSREAAAALRPSAQRLRDEAEFHRYTAGPELNAGMLALAPTTNR